MLLARSAYFGMISLHQIKILLISQQLPLCPFKNAALLTLSEMKAWSFSKLEGLTRPSFSMGLFKPSLSQLDSQISMEPQPAFDKFPFSRQAEVALLMQNGVLQGLDESVPEEDISCRVRPLKVMRMRMRPFLRMVSPSAGQLSGG